MDWLWKFRVWMLWRWKVQVEKKWRCMGIRWVSFNYNVNHIDANTSESRLSNLRLSGSRFCPLRVIRFVIVMLPIVLTEQSRWTIHHQLYAYGHFRPSNFLVNKVTWMLGNYKMTVVGKVKAFQRHLTNIFPNSKLLLIMVRISIDSITGQILKRWTDLLCNASYCAN